MTSSGSERDRASGSSDEDGSDLKKALRDYTLHEVRSLAGKTVSEWSGYLIFSILIFMFSFINFKFLFNFLIF